MSTATYTLSSPLFGLNHHHTARTSLVCDIDRYEELRIHVKSGDYFTQLATILDAAQELDTSAGHHVSKVLSRLTYDLLYLQNHYKIVEKD